MLINFLLFNVLENIIIDKNSLKIENITIEINKKNVCLNTDKTKESININSNNNNNNSIKLAPIADCEIFGNSESSSSGSKTTESEKNSTGDNVSNNLKSTSDSIGNVLNNAIKVNVVDGLLKKSDNNSNNISKNNNNNNNIDSCEVVSDEESESEYGLKHKQKYMCLSNSSLNDSVSSALSSSNLTVRIF